MRVVCLIQARLTSTRLPGKVLRPIGEHEVLWHVYARCAALFSTAVILPYGPENEPLAAWCAERAIEHYCGPEDDVLSRYAIAAAAWDCRGQDIVIRVTADCPFLDGPRLVAAATDLLNHPHHSYTLIDNSPQGTWCECIRADALYLAASAPHLTSFDREHVTQVWRRNIAHMDMKKGHSQVPEDWDTWRWTLDTPEDYAWFQEIATHINTEPPHPTTEELCALFAERPDLIRRNPV